MKIEIDGTELTNDFGGNAKRSPIAHVKHGTVICDECPGCKATRAAKERDERNERKEAA